MMCFNINNIYILYKQYIYVFRIIDERNYCFVPKQY
jgi:hypothetical protein